MKKTKTLHRPDRTPDEIRKFMREVFDEFARLEIPVGGAFTIVPGDGSFKLENHDDNALGGVRNTDPATSRKARLQNFPQSGSQRHKALAAIAAAGSHGLTGHEVAEQTGIEYRSVTPRLRELKDGGWIEDADFTRKTNLNAEAQVLVATDKGRRECQERFGYREDALL